MYDEIQTFFQNINEYFLGVDIQSTNYHLFMVKF